MAYGHKYINIWADFGSSSNCIRICACEKLWVEVNVYKYECDYAWNDVSALVKGLAYEYVIN